MKATIDVADRREAELLRAGLEDPQTRALVKVIGALAGLPSDRARRRVLEFVADRLAEQGEQQELAVIATSMSSNGAGS